MEVLKQRTLCVFFLKLLSDPAYDPLKGAAEIITKQSFIISKVPVFCKNSPAGAVHGDIRRLAVLLVGNGEHVICNVDVPPFHLLNLTPAHARVQGDLDNVL